MFIFLFFFYFSLFLHNGVDDLVAHTSRRVPQRFSKGGERIVEGDLRLNHGREDGLGFAKLRKYVLEARQNASCDFLVGARDVQVVSRVNTTRGGRIHVCVTIQNERGKGTKERQSSEMRRRGVRK